MTYLLRKNVKKAVALPKAEFDIAEFKEKKVWMSTKLRVLNMQNEIIFKIVLQQQYTINNHANFETKGNCDVTDVVILIYIYILILYGYM